MAQRKPSKAKNKKGNKASRWLSSHTQLVTILVFAILFGAVGTWYLRDSNALESDINTSNKATVNSAYWSLYGSPLTTVTNWVGSVSTCKAGTISESARDTMSRVVNFARRMNHLSPVGNSNDTANANTQKTALMMDANNKLSHSPSSSWRCYTSAGATTAAKSNIGLASYNIQPAHAIKSFLDDQGSSNTAVGHRRWLLLPEANVFGFGMTTTAYAVQVVGLSTDSSNPNPAWVAWPSAGYFPDALEPAGRWSLSAGSSKIIFKDARISVTRSGTNVPVTKYAVHNGYARPTLVWQMPSGFSKTGTYVVKVTNIKRSGTSDVYSRQYSVTFFTPTK